ncbi:MAG: sugar phosphate nucleotidyltransferase [Bacteroidota bacterium]
MQPNIVILAAGIASRMRTPRRTPAGTDARLLREAEEKTKSMIGVGMGGRPFLDYLIYNVREAGYTDVVLVVGEESAAMRAHYGERERGNPYHGVTISYAVQRIPGGRTKPLGTADAVLCAMMSRPDWAETQFTVCNSDNLYSINALRLMRETAAPCALIDYDRDALGFEPSRIEKFAVLQTDSEGYLTGIIEKPSPDEIARLRGPSGRIGVSMNIFRFAYDLMLQPLKETPLHPVRLEKEIPAALMLLIARHPRSVLTIPLAERVPDLTSKEDIAEVQRFLARNYPGFEL